MPHQPKDSITKLTEDTVYTLINILGGVMAIMAEATPKAKISLNNQKSETEKKKDPTPLSPKLSKQSLLP